MPRKDPTTGQISAQAQQDLLSDSIENFELPKSLVTKIAKSALSENSKLQKDIVLSIVKSSTVFINYLTATAHDVALSKQHKSISASDVLKALEIIEFGDLVDKLQTELQVYRDNAKSDKGRKASTTGSTSAKGKSKEVDPAASGSTTPSKSKPKPSASPLTTAPRASQTGDVPLDPLDSELMRAADVDADVGADEEEMLEDEEELDAPMDEEDEQDEGDEGELEDVMAIEDEELRRDALSVEERDQPQADLIT